MGAKQSKRSVDISGKEAESAGEVAAAGAGGEGRVEQLADADALKPQPQPQLNGDAHIHESPDKEKQLDSGTPENEKDATTEKEAKEAEEAKEKEAPAITNGESEPKEENGEAVAAEDGKKPKKEKVKKKWSLRSISFSRKDKPKQEKKSKDEDARTPNGEQEKLPEEAAETPETAVNEVAEEAKSDTETKDDKTPETPVTEPITNGSNTPESPKTEPSPTIDEPLPESPKDNNRPEPKAALPEPEQLPVNGLSLEEPKVEAPEVVKCEESNIEKATTETTESVPAPEMPVIKEVCVEQMPMIEPSPPPLPANPPPSSVASFAATTMAPELTDASLATTADITSTAAPIATIDTNTDVVDNDPPETNHIENDTDNTTTDIPSEIKETVEETTAPALPSDPVEEPVDIPVPAAIDEVNGVLESEVIPEVNEKEDDSSVPQTPPPVVNIAENLGIPEIVINESHSARGTPSPNMNEAEPEQIDDHFAVGDEKSEENSETATNDKIAETNETIDDIKKLKKKVQPLIEEVAADVENIKDKVEEVIEEVKPECNGKMEEDKSETEEIVVDGEAAAKETTPEDSMPPSLSEMSQGASNDASESFPLPPSDLCPESQDILPVADKIADLIPDVPVVPELKTDMEQTTDVAVAN